MNADAGEARHVRWSEGPVVADIHVPASKSVANRALICAALADGESEIHGIAPGDDTTAMLECLGALGIRIHIAPPLDPAEADAIGTVIGTGGILPRGPIELHTRLAGTTSRFITALAALGIGPYSIDGAAPLRARPMAPLHDSLKALGAVIEPGQQWGQLPVTVRGPLRGADAIVMPGNVSSQYVTALMLIAPYIANGIRLGLSTALVSRPYVEITRAVMAAFGVDDVDVAERRIHVAPGRYRPCRYRVEADASSASYPLAVAAIRGGAVRVRGMGSDSLQGDARFVDVLASMGCIATIGTDDTVLMRRTDEPLRGIDIDMSDISDLVPTMTVVATQATTPTRISGVGFIRAKESDRLGDLASELNKTGADVRVEDDGLLVVPTATMHGARLSTHHDHRLAMAFGVLGLVVDGIEVERPEVVSKSWPEFWTALDSIPATSG